MGLERRVRAWWARPEDWEHGMPPGLLRALPFVLLGVSTLLAIFLTPGSTASPLVTLGMALVTAAWVLAMFTLHPGWAGRPGVMAIYLAGLLVATGFLETRSGWFGIFVVVSYYTLYEVFPLTWALLAMPLPAALSAAGLMGGIPWKWPPLSQPSDIVFFVALTVVYTVLSGGGTMTGHLLNRQNQQRKRAIVELEEANRRLETALEENAGLHVQLLTQAREAGVSDERQRMAREIHDTLAQGLAGIVAQLEAADRAGDDGADRRHHVDQARTLARESLREARRSVQALQPEPLERVRLPEAIGEMAKAWAATSGIEPRLEVTGEPVPLLAEIEVTLFRVAQEALTNIAKHARAGRVGLTLSYMDDVVLLDVRDDGAGFDPAALHANGRRPGQGFGLSSMRQRLRQVAGSLEVESAPGEGTSINARVPALPAGAPV